MKKTKLLIAALMIGIFFTGCAKGNNETSKNPNANISNSNNLTQTNANNETSVDFENKDYDIIGEIIEINNDTVSILSGDIAEQFTFDKETLKNFYIGENVVVKDDNILSYIPKDLNYDINHNSIDELIFTKTGIVKSVSDKSFVVTIDDDDVNFNSYLSDEELSMISKGMNITIEYLERDGEKWAIKYYNEDNTLDLTVTSIEKDEETNIVLINAEDSSTVKYIINVNLNTDINFAHSQLKAGDKIKVYPTFINDSLPAQVDATKVLKQ